MLSPGTLLEVGGKPLRGRYRRLKMVDGKRTIETVEGTHPKAEQYTKIDVVDWDLDGDLDLLTGHNQGFFLLYRNRGSRTEPLFGLPEEVRPETGDFPGRPSPTLVDWDGDGRRDLLVGSSRSGVWFYRNVGEDGSPRFIEGVALKAGGAALEVGDRARASVTDWNNDGVHDLLVGDFFVKRDPSAPRGRTMGGHVWLFLGEKAGEEEEGF